MHSYHRDGSTILVVIHTRSFLVVSDCIVDLLLAYSLTPVYRRPFVAASMELSSSRCSRFSSISVPTIVPTSKSSSDLSSMVRSRARSPALGLVAFLLMACWRSSVDSDNEADAMGNALTKLIYSDLIYNLPPEESISMEYPSARAAWWSHRYNSTESDAAKKVCR